MSLKVMTIVGTRPELIKLSRVLAKLEQHTRHVLVHTGQNFDYELNEVFFRELGIQPPAFHLGAAGHGAAETIGLVITRVDEILEREAPDAVLILGDTNRCLCAIAAKRRHIPVFHMEAGNRCFDQRVPEEINRTIVDHISDINMPYSDLAREYLVREGIPPDRIIKTGSPMCEVLHHYRPQIDASDALTRLELEREQYFLVSFHREENVDSERNIARFGDSINRLAANYGLRIIVSTHPRTRKRLDAMDMQFDSRVELMKPLGFFDFVHLQMHARAVLSDSGTITEESSILNFPALNIREAHERPEGMEEGAVMMTGVAWERIQQALWILDSQPRGEQRLLNVVRDYTMPNVSDKVLRILISYTDYVNQVVWRKPS